MISITNNLLMSCCKRKTKGTSSPERRYKYRRCKCMPSPGEWAIMFYYTRKCAKGCKQPADKAGKHKHIRSTEPAVGSESRKVQNSNNKQHRSGHELELNKKARRQKPSNKWTTLLLQVSYKTTLDQDQMVLRNTSMKYLSTSAEKKVCHNWKETIKQRNWFQLC